LGRACYNNARKETQILPLFNDLPVWE